MSWLSSMTRMRIGWLRGIAGSTAGDGCGSALRTPDSGTAAVGGVAMGSGGATSAPARCRARAGCGRVLDDRAGDVDAGGGLDALQPRRGVDLQHQRPALRADQV